MNQYGQLFSLDFLIAMGLVILLFGTVLSLGHQQAFEIHETNQRNELAQASEHAVVALVSDFNTTCTLFANGTGQVLETNVNNCLDWPKIQSLNSSGQLSNELGLPQNYGFLIKTAGQPSIAYTSLPNGGTVFSMDLNAIVYSGNVPKNLLYRCIKKQGCALSSQVVSFQSWKG